RASFGSERVGRGLRRRPLRRPPGARGGGREHRQPQGADEHALLLARVPRLLAAQAITTLAAARRPLLRPVAPEQGIGTDHAPRGSRRLRGFLPRTARVERRGPPPGLGGGAPRGVRLPV